MNMDQLQYIVEVARTGSISKASEKLFITQSAISQSITSLEEELGLKIFTRSRNGMVPTQQGKIIIQKAFEILNTLHEIQEVAQAHSQSIYGELKLCVIPGSAPLIFQIIQGFKQKYPNISIEIKEMGCHEILEYLNKNHADIGLSTIYEGLLNQMDKHDFEILKNGEMMLYAKKNTPLAVTKSIAPQELRNYPIVFLNTGYGKWFYEQLTRKFGPLNLLFVSDSTDSVRKAILSGIAVSFIPDYCMLGDPDIENGYIVPIRIRDYEATKVSLGWIRPKERPLSICVSKFIEYVNFEFKQIC